MLLRFPFATLLSGENDEIKDYYKYLRCYACCYGVRIYTGFRTEVRDLDFREDRLLQSGSGEGFLS